MFENFTNKNESSFESDVFGDDNEDTLENSIEEIELENLDVGDLVKLEECQGILEEIKNDSPDTVSFFEQKTAAFLERINDAYSQEDLDNCALYCLLTSVEIPPDVETLDLEGEYSIETFLKDFLDNNNLN